MVRKFRKKIGPPDEVIIGIGDWSQAPNLKLAAPTKGIGFRKLFRRHGYSVFLVDEHRTSVTCSYGCGRDTREKMDKYTEKV